ncbi:pyocin activator PrtN family protein [Lysobacter sp. Root690]|uniref:pyocin activator PrtN family protein n=1 Tax=Lysobacter sp. Root690 TaxID=1736588 RepID=UPI0006F73049|nr:pyocin activator PrtN family protein [Lysobacter sp. Root690]KRB11143.1 hypothetical protein ASD86_01500 [Lysobacter sp. Root690]
MNTLLLLMAEYETAQIPLDRCSHLFGMTPAEAAKRACRHALPVPVYRVGSQKSPWIVDATQLADYLDKQKAKAADEWRRINSQLAVSLLDRRSL